MDEALFVKIAVMMKGKEFHAVNLIVRAEDISPEWEGVVVPRQEKYFSSYAFKIPFAIRFAGGGAHASVIQTLLKVVSLGFGF